MLLLLLPLTLMLVLTMMLVLMLVPVLMLALVLMLATTCCSHRPRHRRHRRHRRTLCPNAARYRPSYPTALTTQPAPTPSLPIIPTWA